MGTYCIQWSSVFEFNQSTRISKGKFGIIYTNVGTYEGKQLDLKIP